MPLGIARRDVRLSRGRIAITDEQTSFAGGLNTVSADDALGPTQFRRGDNGRLTQFGAFTKRGGSQQTAAALIAATTVQNGYAWNQPAGTVVTMAVCGGTLYTTTYGTFPLTWTKRGNTGDLATTVTPSLAEFLQLAGTDSVYIADGGLLNRYTGTTLTTNIASTPSCNVLAVHNQRLWGTGDPAYPDSVFYSALNDGDSLGIGASGGGQIVVRTFGDQNAVGVVSLGTSLMVFHQRGVSRITGYGQSDVTAAPAAISGDVGTIAPFSIVRVHNVVFFVSERGLHQASEMDVSPVNSPEKPDPLSIILPLMSSANIANIRVAFSRAFNELRIAVPGYGIFVYHTILQAWCGPWVDGYESPETSCLFETNNASGYPIILRGDTTGFVSECDRSGVFLDNVAAAGTGGTSFVATLQCKRFYAGDANLAKSWRYGYVVADLNGSNASAVSWNPSASGLSVSLPYTGANTWGGSSTTWGAGTWGATGQTSYRVMLDGNSYYLDVTLTDSGQAMPVFSQMRVAGYALGRR